MGVYFFPVFLKPSYVHSSLSCPDMLFIGASLHPQTTACGSSPFPLFMLLEGAQELRECAPHHPSLLGTGAGRCGRGLK